jgi:hypothetical protein
VEVRWSELPRPRLVFLALGLEGALGESGSQGRRFALSRQSAHGRERPSWRVRLSRSPLPSKDQERSSAHQCITTPAPPWFVFFCVEGAYTPSQEREQINDR